VIATNSIVTDDTVRLCLGSWGLTLRLVLLLVAMGVAGMVARARPGQ
jgi:hypothetical protein